MESKNFGDMKPFDQALFNEDLGSARSFLSWLKHKDQGVFEWFKMGYAFCESQKHGHMGIMTTGMHLSVVHRTELGLGLFGDIERIHIGTKSNRVCALSGLDVRSHRSWP